MWYVPITIILTIQGSTYVDEVMVFPPTRIAYSRSLLQQCPSQRYTLDSRLAWSTIYRQGRQALSSSCYLFMFLVAWLFSLILNYN